MIHLLAGFGCLIGSYGHATDTTSDPAYKMLSTLVGGHWVGTLGKMNVTFSFDFIEGGKMIEGKGSISDGKKDVLTMDSKFGWDAAVKQTFYLDCHGHDTVYNGHVTLNGKRLVFDFVGLIGDKGHWISYATFPEKDVYAFEMYEAKGGQLVPNHIGVKYHRVR